VEKKKGVFQFSAVQHKLLS